MPQQAEHDLRKLITSGIGSLNQENGGRFLSQVAQSIGVDRATITRWNQGTATASYKSCQQLAHHFPKHFDWEVLAKLHSRAALSGSIRGDITVGISASTSIGAVHEAAIAALSEEPDDPRQRQILHVMFHLDYDADDPLNLDKFVDDNERQLVTTFRNLFRSRVEQGWQTRTVFATDSPSRLEDALRMSRQIEGPDVLIRAYHARVPLVICPLIIAQRDVILAHDEPRLGRPHSAIRLRSPTAVEWATDYFNSLWDEAPIRIRTSRGIDTEQVSKLRDLVALDPTTS